MLHIKLLLSLLLLVAAKAFSQGNTLIQSPDQKISFTLSVKNNSLNYSISSKGKQQSNLRQFAYQLMVPVLRKTLPLAKRNDTSWMNNIHGMVCTQLLVTIIMGQKLR